MTGEQKEPPDDRSCTVAFDVQSLRFMLKAAQFYRGRLEEAVKGIKEDPSLAEILSLAEERETLLDRELSQAQRAEEWLHGQSKPSPHDISLQISHGMIRYLKAVCRLYLRHLRKSWDEAVSRLSLPSVAFENVDRTLAHFEELFQSGVLATATEIPLMLADQAEARTQKTEAAEPGSQPPPRRGS